MSKNIVGRHYDLSDSIREHISESLDGLNKYNLNIISSNTIITADSKTKKNVSVEVEENVLTISGDKHGFEDNGGKCITRELKHSSFKRSFNLGEQLDGDEVTANFKDGILSINIPKVEPELPKKNIVKIK